MRATGQRLLPPGCAVRRFGCRSLGLGHVRGIIPIIAVFLALVWAEKVLNWKTVAFYWLAIIVRCASLRQI